MPAYLGEFEQLVLLAILRLGPRATGAAIRAVVEEGTGRTVWIGAVHTTLDRLETKGLVRSAVVTTDPRGRTALRQEGARPPRRKVYALPSEGRAAISQAYDTWVRMTRGLKPKLESR